MLLQESLALLNVNIGGCFVDATLGIGGHTEAILAASAENRVLAVDQDRSDRARPQAAEPI